MGKSENLYYYCRCIICTNDVLAPNINMIHFLYDNLDYWKGLAICEGCYNDLKNVIPNHLDLIGKKYGFKSTPKDWKKCRKCKLFFPTLSKEKNCNNCENAVDKTLEKWEKSG